MVEKMDDRKRDILRAVTDDYISSGEPVGSRTIARKYKLGLSPATIRNEMADLEESGFLEQPHTSSGRIPSDRGYRYYVDALMQQRPMTPEEINNIRSYYETQKEEFEGILRQTAKILTQMTNYPSFSSAPKLSQSMLRHIQFLPLSDRNVLIILVMDSGHIEHRIMQMSQDLESGVLEKFSNALNQQLIGKHIQDITMECLKAIRTDLILHDYFFDQIIKMVLEAMHSRQKDKLFLEGASHILEQPEFKQIDKVKPILELFEEEDKLYAVLTGDEVKEKIKVYIGKENDSSMSLSDCSVVTAVYDLGGQTFGKIGILGPKRMDYAKMVAMVQYVSQYLSELIKGI
ncbi:MAG: heat-inducible transcriptional repressor HrcA [Bacillota bacterium]